MLSYEDLVLKNVKNLNRNNFLELTQLTNMNLQNFILQSNAKEILAKILARKCKALVRNF